MCDVQTVSEQISERERNQLKSKIVELTQEIERLSAAAKVDAVQVRNDAANILEAMAQEEPINGNELAQIRVLMAAGRVRRGEQPFYCNDAPDLATYLQNEALEKAATICDLSHEDDNRQTPSMCARDIRALKSSPVAAMPPEACLQALQDQAQELDMGYSKPQPDNVIEALHEAVSAIYFDDSHLYRGALGNIVRFLNPKVYAVLENDSAAAYEITEHILALRKPKGQS